MTASSLSADSGFEVVVGVASSADLALKNVLSGELKNGGVHGSLGGTT